MEIFSLDLLQAAKKSFFGSEMWVCVEFAVAVWSKVKNVFWFSNLKMVEPRKNLDCGDQLNVACDDLTRTEEWWN